MEKLNKIATNLKAEKRFICFNAGKQPISSKTLKPISIKNRGNLITFENALESLKNSSKIEGIGFVLGNTPKGNFCGLDIDNCIDSNGVISNKAKEIIDFLDTYTEISPSGNGVHCIFFANKQGNKCKKYFDTWCKCIEIYDKDRYFTLTGNVIKSKNIEHRQDECNFIYETYLEDFLESSKNIPKIKNTYISNNKCTNLVFALKNDKVLSSYWHGNRPLKSESENDFALMGKILFWVGYENINTAIQYFIESPYAQQKDEQHLSKILNTSYLERTVQKIINSKFMEVEHE